MTAPTRPTGPLAALRRPEYATVAAILTAGTVAAVAARHAGPVTVPALTLAVVLTLAGTALAAAVAFHRDATRAERAADAAEAAPPAVTAPVPVDLTGAWQVTRADAHARHPAVSDTPPPTTPTV